VNSVLTERRVRAWSVVLVAFWLPAALAPLWSFWDFSAFYSAGALVGHRELETLVGPVSYQAGLGLPTVTYVNTPAFAFLYAPLAALPYAVAGWIAMAAMFGLLVAAVEVGRRPFGIPRSMALVGALLWPPAAAAVVSNQTAPLALFLVAVAFVGLRRGGTGDLLAGIAIAGLAYKPQLALPLLALLVVRARWRALAATFAGFGAHYLLGVFATGGDWQWPSTWLSTVNAWMGYDVIHNWQSVSLVVTLGGSPVIYVALAVVGIALVPSLRRRPLHEAIAVATVAGLVASPHALIYDATLALPMLAMLGRPRIAFYVAAALWPLGGIVGFQPLSFLLAIWVLSQASVGLTKSAAAGQPAPTGSPKLDEAAA